MIAMMALHFNMVIAYRIIVMSPKIQGQPFHGFPADYSIHPEIIDIAKPYLFSPL